MEFKDYVFVIMIVSSVLAIIDHLLILCVPYYFDNTDSTNMIYARVWGIICLCYTVILVSGAYYYNDPIR